MRYLLGFVCALALGVAGCGGEQHHAHHGEGGKDCSCEHKAGEHCEHCKQEGKPCDCDHKAGEHCEHCKGKGEHAHGDHHAHGGPGEHGGHHDAEMKGKVGELHAVLAPVWHDKGADRLTKACDQVKAMQDGAAAVEAAPPPEGANVDAYKGAAKELTAAGGALATACAAAGRPDVEAKFSAFHDAFHKVAESVSGKPHADHH